MNNDVEPKTSIQDTLAKIASEYAETDKQIKQAEESAAAANKR